jgi:hypothetical protein
MQFKKNFKQLGPLPIVMSNSNQIMPDLIDSIHPLVHIIIRRSLVCAQRRETKLVEAVTLTLTLTGKPCKLLKSSQLCLQKTDFWPKNRPLFDAFFWIFCRKPFNQTLKKFGYLQSKICRTTSII